MAGQPRESVVVHLDVKHQNVEIQLDHTSKHLYFKSNSMDKLNEQFLSGVDVRKASFSIMLIKNVLMPMNV